MMSKSFVIFCFLVGSYLLAISQTGDTLYFDKSWHPCQKKESKYYRLVQKEDSVYRIRDYYNSGVLQMSATAIQLEPEILEGQSSYYYSNGNIESAGIYRKGEPIGIWSYYNSKGYLTDTYNYSLVSKSNRDSARLAQKAYKRAISETDNRFSFVVRGKVAGFFIIEDNYFSTATIGSEVLFKGRHSLGVDYTYFGWQYEHDDADDNALYETYERRGYVYFDYKYKFFAYKRVDLYLNAYDKIGTYHMWHEGVSEGYNFWEKPFLKDKVDGSFNQVGAGIGFKYYFNDRFYLDASANGGKLFTKNNAITYNDSLQITNRQYNLKEDKAIFYIRVNFGYKLFVKHKKDEDVFYTN
ncbi:MAG: hypothetical protein HY062_11150 [Bacteroidetes bacterium]|nr:hypothetical protein [Bacteroidota bacterium]